ncbi:protein of unknown function [Candidatus Hydrogenisulfobacillus filiaventi]|uniref:Uncharacterized protein n=1 Tax=Candidatus Hydrogenisulfobacillus filiaventi TaxID=2707344 RepID=A0A6F8ZJ18_9FIRM|nr:protein of unknown function [Candidatus Hydrogenisulfobacillus filiaventi]
MTPSASASTWMHDTEQALRMAQDGEAFAAALAEPDTQRFLAWLQRRIAWPPGLTEEEQRWVVVETLWLLLRAFKPGGVSPVSWCAAHVPYRAAREAWGLTGRPGGIHQAPRSPANAHGCIQVLSIDARPDHEEIDAPADYWLPSHPDPAPDLEDRLDLRDRWSKWWSRLSTADRRVVWALMEEGGIAAHAARRLGLPARDLIRTRKRLRAMWDATEEDPPARDRPSPCRSPCSLGSDPVQSG